MCGCARPSRSESPRSARFSRRSATSFATTSTANGSDSGTRPTRGDFTNAPPHSTTTRGLHQPNAFSGPGCRIAGGGSTGHARIAVGDASFRSLRARNDNGQKLGQQNAISRNLLPHGDVGAPELVQSKVAFAGCQAARYQFISVAIRDAFCGSRRVRQIREPCLE